MLAPTFEPGAQPGEASLVAQQQETTNQSWMDRAQARAQKQQEMQLQQQEIERNTILRPVIEAKARADVVTAAATLSSAHRMQTMREDAAMTSPKAIDEFLAATKIPHFEDQDSALAQLQAKYSWMENVPEYKPFVDSLNTARAKTVQMVIANKHIEGVQMAADTRAAAQVAVENVKKDAAAERQTKDLEHKREVDDLNQQLAKLKAETAITVGGGHDTARTTAAETAGTARVQSSAGRAFAEEADVLEQQAQKETDPDAKSVLQRKAQVYRTKSEQALKPAGAGASSPQPAADAATAPTRVDKNATSITIGGKTYPVFKDAQGNRAYKIDGHFVPLIAE